MSKLQLINGLPRMASENSAPTVGGEYFDVVVSGASGQNQRNEAQVTASTPVTIPNSATYTDNELIVLVNNIPQDNLLDFNWVGTAPRTQIFFTYNLKAGDHVRFRI
jgi:hypothetical protein